MWCSRLPLGSAPSPPPKPALPKTFPQSVAQLSECLIFFFLRQSTQPSLELQKNSLQQYTRAAVLYLRRGEKITKVFQPPLVLHTKVKRTPMLTLEVENPSQDCLLPWVLVY